MAKTIYRSGKPYKHISDSGKVTRIKDGKDPISSRTKQRNSSSSSKAMVQISASLSTDGKTETIRTTKGGKTTTVITHRSGGSSSSKTVSGGVSAAQQRQIVFDLEKAATKNQKVITLRERQSKLAKLEKEKGLRAEIKTKEGLLIQKGIFKISKTTADRIINLTRNIKNEKERLRKIELLKTHLNVQLLTKWVNFIIYYLNRIKLKLLIVLIFQLHLYQ